MTGVPAWLAAELETVGEYAAFEGVDGLVAEAGRIAAAHPDVVTARRIGTSALGEPLHCLTIRGGAPEAVVFGLPHPNEPIGGLTALHLARRLAEDAGLRARLGHTWHIVPCIDPDGLRLNEGWLAGPFTREHYARHFYRPAGAEQVEWTFPLDHDGAYFDAVLPETFALMRLIDAHTPALMASLHNAELGGVYYYLSRDEPALYPVLQGVPELLGLPLHRGEPEAPWIPVLADGVYQTLDIRDAYDHYARTGRADAVSGGNSTASYAEPHGTLTLVSELPYWQDPRFSDTTPTTERYADALRTHAAELADLAAVLGDHLTAVSGLTSVDSPFLRATRFYARTAADLAEDMGHRGGEPAADRPATVAEVASVADSVHMYRLRYGGMLVRALEAELALGNVRPGIRHAHAALSRRYDAWLAEAAADSHARPIPIRTLVATQYASVIAAAAHLSGRSPDPR
ncbi:M14 family zinc carboxypeptidase [Pseudonocardia xishanensis]|uniref:M14 family zinc carboxypeptidase n=1 Tax=Pseudonocardia xishanensis TaxID=630995 RepID=A0ABP8RI81_9PSEU